MPDDGDEAEIYVDGAARGNPGPAGIGYIIKRSSHPFTHREYVGKMTNNQAEYTALIKALENALSLGLRRVRVYSDSVLLVKQVTGEYRVRNPRLAGLHQLVSGLVRRFEKFEIIHVAREKNLEADRLANEAIDTATP